MIIKFLIGAFLFAAPRPGDSIQNFRKQLARNIELYMPLPPEILLHDTCYHNTDLLKVEVNKSFKVVSIELSDSAPAWLKKELNEIKERKRIDYKKLDSLALKAGLRNCTLVFPLIVESDYFPCGKEKKKRSVNESFFKFGGANLKGNIIFGEQIKLVWPVDYRVQI
jgi:hypothetical protein